MANLRILFRQGGLGSGNHDHAGRPGQVGGSTSTKTNSPYPSRINFTDIDIHSTQFWMIMRDLRLLVSDEIDNHYDLAESEGYSVDSDEIVRGISGNLKDGKPFIMFYDMFNEEDDAFDSNMGRLFRKLKLGDNTAVYVSNDAGHIGLLVRTEQ